MRQSSPLVALVLVVALPAAAVADWIAPRITLADVANVAEGDTLTMRAEPSPRAAVVGRLPTFAGVDVNRCLRDPHDPRGTGPNWCHVSWGDGGSGWVNARFLLIHKGVHRHVE